MKRWHGEIVRWLQRLPLWRRYSGMSREVRKDLLEGGASLMLCNVGDYISGLFLHFFEQVIRAEPLIIALLPAASDARGDVYSSYGSRLGTLLHLGILKRYLKSELFALVTLLICANLWVGILISIVNGVVGDRDLDLIDVLFIPLFSAIISAFFMVPTTTWLALASFKHGLDPDNLVSPITTLFGDLVTIPTIVLGYFVAKSVSSYHKLAVIGVLILVAVASLAYTFYRLQNGDRIFERTVKVVRENLPVVILAISFSAVAGVILLGNIEEILAWKGLLAVVPAFLEDGGAIACRFSARLTTMLHLGRVKLEIMPRSKWIWKQIGINFVHALILFTALGVFGAIVSISAGVSCTWATKIFFVVLLAGLLLTLIISTLTYYLALLSFKIGIDPDNVLAPILTSIADVVGTASLALMLNIALLAD